MSSSNALTDINSNLIARGLPSLCWMKSVAIVTRGSNKDIWDAGALGFKQGHFPPELNASLCY